MSSIILSKPSLPVHRNTYKVVLFVGGLGKDGTFFNNTIKNLYKSNSKRIEIHDSMIDMSYFDSNEYKFIDKTWSSLDIASYREREVQQQISSLVSQIKRKPNGIVLAKVKIDTFPLRKNNLIKIEECASIEDQSKKTTIYYRTNKAFKF